MCHITHESQSQRVKALYDGVAKGEMFDAHVRGKFNVALVLDDRTSVVAYWRSLGLTVFQVAEGDF